MARKKKQLLQVVVKSAKRLPTAKQSKSALKQKAKPSASTRSGASKHQKPARAQSGKKPSPTPMKQSPRATTTKASKSPVATTSSSMEVPTKVAVIAVPRLNISPFQAKAKKSSLIQVETRPLVPIKTAPEKPLELGSVQCQDCFLQLPTPQDLAKHKQVCVRRSFTRIFSCHTCLTCFCTQDELNQHCATHHAVKESSSKTTPVSTPKQKGTARQKRVPVYAKESKEQIKVLRVPPGVNPEDAIMRTYGVKLSQIIYKNPSGKSPVATSPPPAKRTPESKEGTTVISVVKSPVKGKLTNPSRKKVEAAEEESRDEEATEESEEPEPTAEPTPSPVVTRTRRKQDNVGQSSVSATRSSPRKGQNPNLPQGLKEGKTNPNLPKGGKTSNLAATAHPVASQPKRSTRSTASGKTIEPKKKTQVQPAEGTAENAPAEDSAPVKRSARVRAREAAGAVVAPWRKLIKGTPPSAAKTIKAEPEEKKPTKPTEETPTARTRSSPRRQDKQAADPEESPKKRARRDEASQEQKSYATTTTTTASTNARVKDSSETESQQQERLLGELHLVKISGETSAKEKSPGKKTNEAVKLVAVKRPNGGEGQKASPTKKLKASGSPARPAICIPNRAKKWNIHKDAQSDTAPDSKSDPANTAKYVRILPKPTPGGQLQITSPGSNKSLNTIPCLACGLRFQSAPTLAAHRRYRCKVMLAEKASHSYTCGCGLKFPTMAELKKHNELERQEGRYPRSEKNRARMVCSCLDCGEQFHRSQLAAHKRECGKLLNIYTKTFACNYCTSFKTCSAQQLKEHIAAYHPSEPVPLYPMFSTPDAETLAKNKPKMCLDCGETFPHDKFLVHKREGCSQEGKSMIYSCFDCHKMFQTRRELEAHKKAVHQVSGEGYMCGWCRESFRLYIDLRLHYERKHSRVVRVPQTQIDNYLQQQLHSQRNPEGPSGPVNFTSRVPGGSGGQGFQISIDTSNPGGPAIRVNPTGNKTEDVSAKLMESERSILKELKSKQSSAAKDSDKDDKEKGESGKDAAKKTTKKEEPAVKHRPAILRRKAAQKSAANAAGKGAAKKPKGQAAAAATGSPKTASQKLDKGFVTVPNLPGVRMLVPVGKGQMVCLQCQTTLQSVEDIASHKCPQTGKKVMVKAEASSPEKKEWNLKPVPAVTSPSDKTKMEGEGEEAATEGGEDVEWFVASSE